MKPSEILQKAKDHISDPAMWHQGNWSRDGLSGARLGLPCCGLGALFWAKGGPDMLGSYACLFLSCAVSKPFEDFSEFNDHPDTTHADVMAVFDRAIKMAKEAGK